MSLDLVLENFLSPPILFFFLGVFATLVRSDLEMPTQVARFLSLYLLFAIGLQGGYKLSGSERSVEMLLMLGAATATSFVIPLWSFALLRLKLPTPDAAAIAATYGSVSAVTFITAISFLNTLEVEYSGHMVAAMALMESPAIIVGVLLARTFTSPGDNGGLPTPRQNWSDLGREAFLNGSVLVLLGSLVIGLVTGSEGWKSLDTFAYEDTFKGVLCLFLLDMGMVAAKRIKDLRDSGVVLVGFAIAAAVVHAMLGIVLAKLIGASEGDALLLASLVGGASYIAVPAAVRLAIPKANPSLYVPMALGLTFPFNVIIGIPMYYAIIKALWS
ncbi:MAG: sodium-dependent bicarbonate transport family permease [Phycisphaeraceae bacterium]